MRPGDPSTMPNPFAVDLPGDRRSSRRSVRGAVKFLLLVTALFAVVVVVGSESRRWLVGQLTADFETLDAEQKRTRLAQLAELDELAIPHLVSAMNDPDIAVARTAHDLLGRIQDEWTTEKPAAMLRRQRELVLAIDAISLQLPDDRTGWMSGLLQQAMMETLDAEGDTAREVHRLAGDALARLSLTDRPGPSVLEIDQGDEAAPVRVAARAQPLPVDLFSGVGWSDGGAEDATTGTEASGAAASGRFDSDEAASRQTEADQPGRATDPRPTGPLNAETTGTPPQASIYKSTTQPASSMRLRPVASTAAVVLRDIDRPRETLHRDGSVRPAAQIVQSPLQTYDDASVMHWLGSGEARWREEAKRELGRRGFSQVEIGLAEQVHSRDPATRLAVVEAISRSGAVDPRPWLLMLLDDPQRDVKLRVITALATLDDPAIQRRLRTRLYDEPDAAVAARIRRVLDIR